MKTDTTTSERRVPRATRRLSRRNESSSRGGTARVGIGRAAKPMYLEPLLTSPLSNQTPNEREHHA